MVVLVQVDMGNVVVVTDGCAVSYTLNNPICLWSQITKLLCGPCVAHTKAYYSDDIIFFRLYTCYLQ